MRREKLVSVALGGPGGSGSHGLVEMCAEGGWGRWVSACDRRWSKEDAATVCKLAGFDAHGRHSISLFMCIYNPNAPSLFFPLFLARLESTCVYTISLLIQS